jgi:hypothetical protein
VNDDECTRTHIHALSGIRSHGLSYQAINAYASDRVATGTGSAHARLLLHNCRLTICAIRLRLYSFLGACFNVDYFYAPYIYALYCLILQIKLYCIM